MNDSNQIYEVGFLLTPEQSSEALSGSITAIKDMLATNGASIISEGEVEHVDLHYTMERVTESGRQKYDQAYFGWIKFEIPSENMEALKEVFDGDANIIRHLLVKTIKENTM